MMDKQKQIDEMENDFENINVYDFEECKYCGMLKHNDCDTDCFCKQCAKYFYDVGYRKIPEGAVVLPKRKYILANKVYSDTTLKGWTKEDLIEHIRILEHNWASAEESLENQAKNCEMLLKQVRKETAKEIFAELFYIATIHHSDIANILAWAKEKAKSEGVEVE